MTIQNLVEDSEYKNIERQHKKFSEFNLIPELNQLLKTQGHRFGT